MKVHSRLNLARDSKKREVWRDILVNDLVETGEAELKTGPFGTQLHASDYVQNGTPVINVRNIGFGEIRDGDLEYINDETVTRLSGHLLQAGDLVFGRKGAVDRHVFIRQKYAGWFQGSDCLRLRVSSKEVEPQFLSYCFQTEFHKSWIMSHCSHGATMASLNQEIICRIPLRLPSLSTQRQIIGVLSAYDDLIENCQRRIKILEEMARTLYREWFVNFRFPGHEKIKLAPSPLGPIPKGWEVKTVAESFDISGGGTPPRKEPEYWEGGTIQWFSPSDLTAASSMFMDDSGERITDVGLAKSSARLFPARSVMLTSRATIGAIAINTHEACTNQGFITCLPNECVPLFFLFHWVTENVPTFQRMASGATFKEISRGVFKTIEFIQPPIKLVHRFESVVEPMSKNILALQRQNQNLRRTRDLLLPRLLANQIKLKIKEDHANA